MWASEEYSLSDKSWDKALLLAHLLNKNFDPLFETDPVLRAAAQATFRVKIAGSDGGGEQSLLGRMQCGVSAAFLKMPEEAYGRLKMKPLFALNPTKAAQAASMADTTGCPARVLLMETDRHAPFSNHRVDATDLARFYIFSCLASIDVIWPSPYKQSQP